MSTSIQAIEEQLAATDDPLERAELLGRLCFAQQFTTIDGAFATARELMSLAGESGQMRILALAHLRMGECERHRPRLSAARRHFARAARITRDLGGDPSIESDIHRNLGHLHLLSGTYDKALAELMRAIELIRLVGDREREILLCEKIGDAYRFLGRYREAIDIWFSALGVCGRIGDREGEARLLNLIAILYATLDEFDNALEYFHRVIAIQAEIGNEAARYVPMINIAGVLLSQSNIPAAIAQFEKSLEICLRVGSSENEIRIYSGLGRAWGAIGEYDRALEYHARALELCRQLHNQTMTAVILLYLGDLYGRKQEWETSLDYTLQAMAMGRQMGYRRVEQDALRMAADIYEYLGDIPRSLECYKQYLACTRELQNQSVRRGLIKAEREAARAEADRENTRHQRKIEELEEEMERRQQELTLLALELVQKEEFIEEIKEHMLAHARAGGGLPAGDLLRRIRMNGSNDGKWGIFQSQFDRVYQGLSAMLVQNYRLTPTELKVCMLLRLGFASKEVGAILSASVNTVETHRRRIRKKLAISRAENLVTYLAAFVVSSPALV